MHLLAHAQRPAQPPLSRHLWTHLSIAMTNGLTHFAIAGVGNVGVPTLDALLATPGLAKPVVLTRDAKKNAALQPYLAKTTVVDGVSYEDTEGLARVLKEHRVQVLIVTTGGENGPAQLPLATAAKQASLNLFVSAEFGIDFRFISDSELHPWILGRKQFHGTLNEVRNPHKTCASSRQED